MNRMTKILSEMKRRGEKALVLYFPVGDPAVDDDADWAEKYFANGATVLEIGLPYRTPYLDGKVVTGSMERACAQHSLDDVFEIIVKMRRRCPEQILQIMTYYGNIAYVGMEAFAQKCVKAGVDAVLAPDIPEDQKILVDEVFKRHGLLCLRFAPFHLSDQELEELKTAEGYIFLQAVDGATGVQGSVSPEIARNIQRMRCAGISAPIIPGFGIGTPEQAAAVLEMGADGVVVGSAVVNSLLEKRGEQFIKQLRQAADRVLL